MMMNSLTPYTTPENFELEEIEWEGYEKDFPFHPDFIPFENSTKEIKKKLVQLMAGPLKHTEVI